MKKILSLILVILMMVPFGIVASAAEVAAVDEIPTKLTLPEMPVVTADDVYYLAFKGTESPDTPANAKIVNTQGWDIVNFSPADPAMYNALKSGGTYIACGKIYVGTSCEVAATDSPVMFTALDAKNNINFISRNADGTPLVVNEEGTNEGQLGMFMLADQKTITFHGDVIFDNIVLLDRAGMEKYLPTTYDVGPSGKMVITNTVEFASMRAFIPALSVAEGGYLFLDALGFSSITGGGTIVVGDSIKDQITEDMFKYFTGIVCSSDGSVIYYLKGDKDNAGTNNGDNDKEDNNENNEAVTTTETPATNNTPTTSNKNNNANAPAADTGASADNNDGGNGAIVWIIVGVAVVAVAGVVAVVVIKKKKAE